MSGINDDYCAETGMLQDNCTILRGIDPGNEHLQLIEFDKYGEVSIEPEFWRRYGPKDKKTSHYNLHALEEANEQLREAIKEAREKGLASKID